MARGGFFFAAFSVELDMPVGQNLGVRCFDRAAHVHRPAPVGRNADIRESRSVWVAEEVTHPGIFAAIRRAVDGFVPKGDHAPRGIFDRLAGCMAALPDERVGHCWRAGERQDRQGNKNAH